MTGCCVSWKCLVACLPVDESQQPTWPHDWHSRSATQKVPSVRHSSQASGVFCGGKLSGVSPAKCSHNSAIRPPQSKSNFVFMSWCDVLEVGRPCFDFLYSKRF